MSEIGKARSNTYFDGNRFSQDPVFSLPPRHLDSLT
jgi:hypothetical protein